eukprot:8467114-Pyramimonas_sp.AAC.2
MALGLWPTFGKRRVCNPVLTIVGERSQDVEKQTSGALPGGQPLRGEVGSDGSLRGSPACGRDRFQVSVGPPHQRHGD